MNNSLTIMEQTIRIPSAGETEASAAEEQLATDSQLGFRQSVNCGDPG